MKKNHLVLIGVVIVIVAAVLFLESGKIDPGINGSVVGERGINELLASGEFPEAPELEGISAYLNTEGKEIKISDYRGQVVLIDFWTYTCINCIRTLPFLTTWDEKYKDKGLVIIGVHTPEFEFEKKTENVYNAINRYGIEYAVVQDNSYETWGAFENRFWPRKYLIDAEGKIRYNHIGEGGYAETEAKIQELLTESGQNVEGMDLEKSSQDVRLSITPELFSGYSFAISKGQNIGNEGGLRAGQSYGYTLPQNILNDRIYLEGTWKSNEEDLQLNSPTGSIVIAYRANEVNIVADSATRDGVVVGVFIDGEYITPFMAGSDVQFDGEKAYIIIDEPRLYNVIDSNFGDHLLGLSVVGDGFRFNAFTFGGIL